MQMDVHVYLFGKFPVHEPLMNPFWLRLILREKIIRSDTREGLKHQCDLVINLSRLRND